MIRLCWSLIKRNFWIRKFRLKWKLDFGSKTAQKMKFSIKNFFSRCDQIPSFPWIWLHLLKKSLMENFIFCEVKVEGRYNTQYSNLPAFHCPLYKMWASSMTRKKHLNVTTRVVVSITVWFSIHSQGILHVDQWRVSCRILYFFFKTQITLI